MYEYPRLIDDVSITPFDTSSPEPVFLMHLPTGKKCQISQDLYTLLILLNGQNSVGELAQRLSEQLRVRITEQQVTWIINEKLAPFGVITDQNGQSIQRGSSRSGNDPLSLLFKIPLLSEKRVRPLTFVGQFLFVKSVLISLLILGCIVHVPVYVQLEEIAPSFNLRALSGYSFLTVLVLTGISTIFHELGHLSACHRYGSQYGKLGFGIYLLSPVAYVDVTDSWRLPRWQRVVVDIGGIYFQLIFDILLFGLYLWLREPVLLFSIVAVFVTFSSNLNPMFKFDGYWALSDAMGVPNLHQRVGDLWRQLLPFSAKRQPSAFLRIHTCAKVAVWIYALATAAYFSYFTLMLLWLAPMAVRDYPSILTNALTQAWQSLIRGEILDALNNVLQIIFSTILLVGLFLLTRRFAWALYKAGRGGLSLVHKWWQVHHNEETMS